MGGRGQSYFFLQIDLRIRINTTFGADYHVGSPLGWSNMYNFKAMKNGTNWPVRLALFGDMGNENAQSLGRLQEETQRGHFDAIFHVGVYTIYLSSSCPSVAHKACQILKVPSVLGCAP